MTHYFDLGTGVLVDTNESDEIRMSVEARLSQTYPIVPVSGAALEVVEKGQSVLDKDAALGVVNAETDRPAALETEAEAKENLDEELERLAKANSANAGAGNPPQTPVGEAAEVAAGGEGDEVKTRGDGEKTSSGSGKRVTRSTKKPS